METTPTTRPTTTTKRFGKRGYLLLLAVPALLAAGFLAARAQAADDIKSIIAVIIRIRLRDIQFLLKS